MRRRILLGGAAAAAGGLSLPGVMASAQDRRAQTLRFVPQANLAILDPLYTTATISGVHGVYVFDTLYGADEHMQPRPQMAEGHELSADGRVWRFRLREGLLFHDGTPVRAADCIASLKRWAGRDGQIGPPLLRVVEEWRAVDDRTFELRLSRPFPPLLDAMAKADPTCCFVMPERLASGDLNKPVAEMIGSGPYRFMADEYVTGVRMVYERFAGYRPRPEPPSWLSGGKVAHFPRVEWTVMPDPATAAAALQQGEVDWWDRPSPDLLPLLRRSDVRVEISDAIGRQALMRLNCAQPPFNDVRVRRAVRMAVDQDSYMRATVGDDTRLWSTCRSMWPRGTPYYADAGDAVLPGDLTRAKAELAASGYKGERLVILNPGDLPDVNTLGLVTADLLQKLGMTVDLVQSDWATVVQRRNSREPVERGGWSINHTIGIAVGLANPLTSYTVRGANSGSFWDSARAEDLVQQWVEASSPADQHRIAGQLGDFVLDEASTIPLGQMAGQTAYSKRLAGVLQGPMSYPWSVRVA